MGNQNGQTVTYCRNRSRDRLGYVFLGLLLLFFGFCVGVYGVTQLGEDRTGWDSMEYIKMAVGWLACLGLTAAGIYECWTSVRDAFFPEKSTIAKSIRAQLPRPEEAPGWQQLFDMVDRDLAANGRWFGKVGIGSQWMLGDEVSCLARIRGVFKQDEIHHNASTGRSSRTIRLLIVDDRKQAQITTLQNPQDLDAAIQYLRLRVPAAYFGSYHDYIGYCDRSDEEWDGMERDFQKRRQEAEQRAREAVYAPTGQGFILTDFPDRRRTSQVSREAIAQRLEQLERGQQFKLEPTPPIPAGMKQISQTAAEALSAINCVLDDAGALWLVAQLKTAGNGGNEQSRGFSLVNPTRNGVLEILTALVEQGTVPDVFGPGWQATQLRQSQQPRQQDHRSVPYLNITDGTGVSRKYERFSRRDVELAAEKVADGSYQGVILWLPPRIIFLDAGSKEDARTTIQIGQPENGTFRTRRNKTTGRQAAEWFVGCLEGKTPEGFEKWKDVTREWEKRAEKAEKEKAKKKK